MHRILLVEDSESSLKVVQSALSNDDTQLIIARTLSDARKITEEQSNFDLILLDITLPDGEGSTLMDHWSASPRLRRTPVVFLTGKEDVDSKVAAFARGADDYIVKPVSPRELKARVDARLRRSVSTPEVIRRGLLALHFPMMRATVMLNGVETPIELTSKEFRLVALLAQNEGQVYSRSELVRAVWGRDLDVVNRTVDSHICGARRKLGPAGKYIESVTGSGYRFMAETH
ncbi:MAG: response regulator transcription factor [Bdellovibrionales bacterium]|nr:response regulator transcription factor [Bdellovibrionales bacterium]